MIRFIHTFTEDTIEVLLASGLFRKGHGLKIMHKPDYTAPYDFNSIAKKGGVLYNTLNKLSCPFYIDRFQGGLGYTKTYPYDKELLEEYKSNKNIGFIGFQLHEWASNFRSDQKRIEELCKKEGIAPEKVHKHPEFWERVKNGELSLFLEAYSPEEWAEIPLSLTREQFIIDCEELYTKRLRETQGLIFPTDSYYMAFRTEIQHGAKMLLPEVGWQIPNMRLQISFARGMAKSAEIPWGIYYECWYCNENGQFSIPFSLKDAGDEWTEDLLHKGFGNERPFTQREYGGSSLSLMERAWVYAYFSGAEIIGEEYGICNTFRSCKSTELSPYGETKKRFIDLTEEYTPSGKPYTPFAAVLPKEMLMPDNRLIEEHLEFAPDESFSREYMRAFNSNLEGIFGKNGKYGNMGHTLRNGGLPDICDVLYEDMSEDLQGYDYLIDLTGKNELRKTFNNVISIEEAHKKARELLPLSVSDKLHYTFRKTENGFQALIMNNDGILHKDFSPDIILPEAAVTIPVTIDTAFSSVKQIQGTGTFTKNESTCTLTLKGGEWVILGIKR